MYHGILGVDIRISYLKNKEKLSKLSLQFSYKSKLFQSEIF